MARIVSILDTEAAQAIVLLGIECRLVEVRGRLGGPGERPDHDGGGRPRLLPGPPAVAAATDDADDGGGRVADGGRVAAARGACSMTTAVSPYRGTPVNDTPTNHSLSSSLALAHPTKKSLPRLTDKNRRQHLKKYNKLIKAGFEKSDAAAEVGYSLRAFQLWNRNLNKKWSNQKHK